MSEVRTLTLTEFLTARLDEDEEWARRALVSVVAPVGWYYFDPDGSECLPWTSGEPNPVETPARVLAEVESKRRIVERLSAVGFGMPSKHLADGVLAEMAAPYVAHPDFNPDWLP